MGYVPRSPEAHPSHACRWLAIRRDGNALHATAPERHVVVYGGPGTGLARKSGMEPSTQAAHHAPRLGASITRMRSFRSTLERPLALNVSQPATRIFCHKNPADHEGRAAACLTVTPPVTQPTRQPPGSATLTYWRSRCKSAVKAHELVGLVFRPRHRRPPLAGKLSPRGSSGDLLLRDAFRSAAYATAACRIVEIVDPVRRFGARGRAPPSLGPCVSAVLFRRLAGYDEGALHHDAIVV